MTPYDHFIGEPRASVALPSADRQPEADATLEARRRRHLRDAGFVGLAALLLAIGGGGVAHYRTHRAALASLEVRRNAVPTVRVQTVTGTTSPRDLALPGTMQAFESATIFARQSGYIVQRLVDIGSQVKAGDLLAVVAAPEIDDQLNQARAQLAQNEAALKQVQATESLAKVTSQRSSTLVVQGWQSRQQADTDRLNYQAQTAAVGVAGANIEAQRAQVARLEKEQSYERVIAPFDGAITARNVDTGSLVTADSASGTPMFSIARTNVLRVQVFVPQEATVGLKEGVVAEVQVPEIAGRTFTGKIARTAEALQAGTRTLLVEIDIDNPDGMLTAGLYCTVRFQVPRSKPTIVVPAEALIFNRDGLQVATVENGKAHIRSVQLGEDDGAEVTIASGLEPSDQLIISPPVDLVDGAPVRPTQIARTGKTQTAN